MEGATGFIHPSTGQSLNREEAARFWKSQGLCTTCGKVQTHKKKMTMTGITWKPVTVENQVFKGKCVRCANNSGQAILPSTLRSVPNTKPRSRKQLHGSTVSNSDDSSCSRAHASISSAMNDEESSVISDHDSVVSTNTLGSRRKQSTSNYLSNMKTSNCSTNRNNSGISTVEEEKREPRRRHPKRRDSLETDWDSVVTRDTFENIIVFMNRFRDFESYFKGLNEMEKLAKDEYLNKEIAEIGKILKMMLHRVDMKNTKMVERTTQFLFVLSDSGNVKRKRDIVGQGGLTTLNESMRTNSNNSTIQQNGCSTLLSLADAPETHQSIVDIRMIKWLAGLVTNVEVQQKTAEMALKVIGVIEDGPSEIPHDSVGVSVSAMNKYLLSVVGEKKTESTVIRTIEVLKSMWTRYGHCSEFDPIPETVARFVSGIDPDESSLEDISNRSPLLIQAYNFLWELSFRDQVVSCTKPAGLFEIMKSTLYALRNSKAHEHHFKETVDLEKIIFKIFDSMTSANELKMNKKQQMEVFRLSMFTVLMHTGRFDTDASANVIIVCMNIMRDELVNMYTTNANDNPTKEINIHLLIMEKFSNNADLVCRCTEMASDIIRVSESYSRVLLKNRFVVRLRSAFQMHLLQEQTQHEIIKCLNTMLDCRTCGNEVWMEIAQMEILPALLDSLEEHVLSVDLQADGISLLARMTSDPVERKGMVLYRRMVNLVVRGMEMWPSNETVQEKGCEFFSNAARNPENRELLQGSEEVNQLLWLASETHAETCTTHMVTYCAEIYGQ